MAPGRVTWRWIRRSLIGVGFLAIGATVVYTRVAFAPAYVPASALQSDATIVVEASGTALAFVPRGVDASAPAFIFYPGCPVPAESYAPFGRAIAAEGFPAYLMRVPYLCATGADAQRALFLATEALIRSAPRAWVLGGHSHGGALASQFAADHPTSIAGLVLEGTSHPRDVDLSHLSIPVVKIVATNDGVAPEGRTNAALLPATTQWVRIEGGNHAQFAFYRFQLWDHPATITRDAQQRQVVAAITDVLRYGSRTGS